MYAYFKKLDYFSTECIYSPNAYRGHARTFLKDLEAIRPSAIIGKLFYIYIRKRDQFIYNINFFFFILLLDIIHSGEAFEIKTDIKMPTQKTCERCGYMSSNDVCKACVLLEGLNRGLPQLGIGKESKVVSIFFYNYYYYY